MSRSLAIVFAAAFILECHPAPQAVQTHVQSSTGTAEQASAKPQFTEKAIDPATAYRTKVPASFVGTYLPLTYIRNLKTTGSHILSLRAAVTDGNYPVLALSEEYIYSDNQYDDQYAVDPAEFQHNWTSSDSSSLTDGKGNRYERISTDAGYGLAVEKYYFQILIGEKQYTDGKGDILAIDPAGGVALNGERYLLQLNGLRGSDDTMDLIVRPESGKSYGMSTSGDVIKIYDVHFKQVEGPQLDVDEGTIAEVYTFRK